MIGKRRMLSSSRRLLLVSMDWTRPKDPPMQLGQASLLANLKHHQVPVIPKAWSVNSDGFHHEKILNFVMSHADSNTDLALGAFVWHETSTQSLLNDLRKEKFPGRIILGGPQISYVKKGIEQFYPQADIFIRGYAENALTDLMLSKEAMPVIPGVHYAGKEDLGLSAQVKLEDLPSPYLSGLIVPQPFIRWETQRGCPFHCAFCQHRESDMSMKRRNFHSTRIAEEIAWITKNPIITDLAILDPTFNSGPHYLEIMKGLIEGQYRGKISLQVRAEMMKPEFLDLIQQLNQTAQVVLEIGLQSIHPKELKEVNRPTNLKKVISILQELTQRNILYEISLIFGLPHQTVQTFQESITFCKSYNVPTIYAFPLMLLRGTPMFANKEKLQLIESTDEDISIQHPNRFNHRQHHIPHVISSPSFSRDDWYHMAEIAKSLDEYNHSNAWRYRRFEQPKDKENKKDTFVPKISQTLQHTSY